MKKKSYFQPVVFILIFLCGLYFFASGLIYLIAYKSALQYNQNLEQEFLRIKIYGSSVTTEGNTVSGTFSVIDSNGNEIAVIERSWSGAYLAVDFVQVKLDGNYYVFPSRIFGKNRIIEDRNERKKGINLEKYYNDYGQCMLLGFGSSLKQRKCLYNISLLANKSFPIIDFGLVNTYTLDLSNCKTNTYYSIGYNLEGRLTIQEL